MCDESFLESEGNYEPQKKAYAKFHTYGNFKGLSNSPKTVCRSWLRMLSYEGMAFGATFQFQA